MSNLRNIRRWLYFTVFDVQSCLLHAVRYFSYKKPAHPMSVVYVPPYSIEHSIEPTKFVRRKLYRFSGLIKREDWERVIPLPPKHKTFVDQFSEAFVDADPPATRRGHSDLDRYQSLFESMSSKGFAVPTWGNRAIDPFYLCIGSRGEFLFMTGKHRLALAKVAGVTAIPARISARHWRWQEYRDQLYRKGCDGEISPDQLDAIDHPDLQDVISAVRDVHN